MAKGRFVSKQITIDKKVNDLADPWSMLGFTWLISHADREGRTNGDPAVVKSMIFPRQNGNVSIEYMEEMIISWQNSGLIIYYEDENDRYIQFTGFEKHQTGLRKDREPESMIPEFNPDNCRIVDGEKRVKLSKDKLSQVKAPAEKTGKKIPQKKDVSREFEERMILKFTEITNIKMNPSEYAKNQALWYKPIRSMLFQVDNDIETALLYLEYTIEEMNKKEKKLTYHCPNSLLSTFNFVKSDEFQKEKKR
jgi:hypothetical protein